MKPKRSSEQSGSGMATRYRGGSGSRAVRSPARRRGGDRVGARVTRGLLAIGVSVGACAEPAPLADADSPSALWRAAIQRTEAKLFASDFASSSPAARRASEEFLAALIGSSWQLAETAALL